MHMLARFDKPSVFALILAFGAGAQAQESAVISPLEALADAGTEIVIADNTILNILVDVDPAAGGGVTDNNLTNAPVGAGPDGTVPVSGLLIDPAGHGTGNATVTDGGARMLTVQELNTVVTADAMLLKSGPAMTMTTGSMTINDDSFRTGMNSMTVSSNPSNGNISSTSITMYVTMTTE